MWKLITEVDLTTGESHRGFRYQEIHENKVVDEFTIAEGVALELMKDLITHFPQVVESLIQRVNDEHGQQQPEPEPQVPPPVQQTQVPPPQPTPPPAPQEDVHTPLNLSPPTEQPGQAFTLSDLAPSMEKDAPQG